MKRRTFIQTGVAGATAVALSPRTASARSVGDALERGKGSDVPADSAFMHALANQAVDAATAAGATYAEARVARSIHQAVFLRGASEEERHGLSVRALVRGGWGFTTSPYWTSDDAITLGRDAARQATQNAQYVPTPIALAPAPVATGEWTSPMKIDPLTVPIDEKMDFLRTIDYTMPYRELRRVLGGNLSTPFTTTRDARVLVTSEGTAITQRMYESRLAFAGTVIITDPQIAGMNAALGQQGRTLDEVVSGAGWEEFRDYDYSTALHEKAEKAYQQILHPPRVRALDVGKFTVLLGPVAMRQLLNCSIGLSMNLDRITLRLANSAGTSYLGVDPLTLLGTYDFGSPLLSVTAMPWRPGKTPTHRWDNEGVVPTNVPLITKGILQDFYTTREQATWLASGYQKIGRPLASHGYAGFDDWQAEPTVAAPELVMSPIGTTTLTELAGSVSRGIYIEAFDFNEDPLPVNAPLPTDAQARQFTLIFLSGQEIVNGRLGMYVTRGAVLFDAAQIWKNLMAVGGTPSQVNGTVPGLFRDVAVINPESAR